MNPSSSSKPELKIFFYRDFYENVAFKNLIFSINNFEAFMLSTS